jgi:acetylornithine deacetylase/succinyl-diaminopimelate desuccinylase-like protein
VTVDPENKEFRPANMSPTKTDLFAAIREVAHVYFDGAPVTPRLTSGYTENQMYRPLGIVCYGFSPYGETAEEGSTAHGDNERIPVEEVRRAWRVMFDTVGLVSAAAEK